MPYSGADDKDLPSNVKKLSPKKRRQWVHVFNSAHAKHGESTAFAMANSVVSKSEKALVPTLMDVDIRQVDQEDANYDPYGATDGKGCATCRFYISPNSCLVVAGDISPTGNSKYYTAQAAYTPEPIPVTIVKSDGGEEVALDDEEEIEYADTEPEAYIEEAAKAVLTAKKRNKLKKASFAYVDKDGKGHLPIQDAAHVRNAMARFNQTNMPSSAKAGAKAKIMAAAKKFGVTASNFKDADANADAGAGAGTFTNVIQVFQSFIKSAKDKLAPGTGGAEKPVSAFWIQKSGLGDETKYRVFAVYSNMFKDKHKQIITDAAHKEYVSWLDAGGIKPEYHLWHAGPLSKFGTVDFVDYVDGFTISSGLVDQGKEHIAEALQDKELRVSHGFYGLKGKDECYHLYRTFEISPLPVGAESNTWTALDLAYRENLMPFTDAKKKWLKEVGGVSDDDITRMEATTKSLSDNLKALGIEYKEEGVVEPTPETVAAAPVQVAASQGVDLVALTNGMEAMTKAIGDLAGVVASIKTGLDSVTKEVGDVKTAQAKGVTEAAGDLNLARVAAAVGGAGGFQASNNPATVVNKEAGGAGVPTADEDWFDKIAIAPARATLGGVS